MIFRTV